MDTKTQVAEGLELADPLWIASSHWTASEASLRSLAPHLPAAVTLKTTSSKHGGDGTRAVGERTRVDLENSRGECIAYFSDGPKTLEFLDVATTYTLTKRAKTLLPQAAIGLSVLQGEDYSAIAKGLGQENYAFVELNLKYSLREVPFGAIDAAEQELRRDLSSFAAAFASLPKVVKLSRESTSIIRVGGLRDYLRDIDRLRGVVVVANSLRTRVPPSRTPTKRLSELFSGVVLGEHLLVETFDLIRLLTRLRADGMQIPRIVASGGAVDIGAVLDLLIAGAAAVQLCSALDVGGVSQLSMLRRQLQYATDGMKDIDDLQKPSDPFESHARRSIERARELRVVPSVVFHSFVREPARIGELVRDAIAAEARTGVVPKQPIATEPTSEHSVRLAFSAGNVLPYLVARDLDVAGLIEPQEFESASNFCTSLGKPDFRWDWAFLPESVRRFIEKQGTARLGANAPQKAGVLFSSHFELVGDQSTKVSDVEVVYYFGGTTSRWALERLLEHVRPEVKEIDTKKLFPLLSFWNRKHAILAKRPLTSMYRMFAPEDVGSRWGPIWSCSEEVHLLASQRLASQENFDDLRDRVVSTALKSVAALKCMTAESLSRRLRRDRLDAVFEQLLTGQRKS